MSAAPASSVRLSAWPSSLIPNSRDPLRDEFVLRLRTKRSPGSVTNTRFGTKRISMSLTRSCRRRIELAITQREQCSSINAMNFCAIRGAAARAKRDFFFAGLTIFSGAATGEQSGLVRIKSSHRMQSYGRKKNGRSPPSRANI